MMKYSPPSEKEQSAGHKRETFAKVIPIFLQYKWMLIAATTTYIMFNMIGLVMPWMLKISIDRILPNADYLLFWILCGLMAIIYLFYTIYLLIKQPTNIFTVEEVKLYQEQTSIGYVIRSEKVVKGENYKNGMEQIKAEGERAAVNENIFR